MALSGTFTDGQTNSSFLYNPFKFSVYRTAALNAGNGSFAVVTFDTKTFDTSSNVDIVTNKGRFTAPVAGFYYFNYVLSCATASILASTLYKNGSEIGPRGGDIRYTASYMAITGSGMLQLALGDYVEVAGLADSLRAYDVSLATMNVFQGWLVSLT